MDAMPHPVDKIATNEMIRRKFLLNFHFFYFFTLDVFMWYQKFIQLPPMKRGFHLVTDRIVAGFPELKSVKVGILHVFIQHTSASLTINENADPDVRVDFETAMNHVVPETLDYIHTLEGPDDMPAHIKGAMLGFSLSIPVLHGRLALGTWQGIYLCEHRNRAGGRQLVLTLHGESDAD